jgi:hypothetical protein
MDWDDKIKQMLNRLNEDGVSTAKVNDGQVFCFSKKRLLDLVEQLKKDEQEYCIIFVKDPSKVN